MRRLLGVRACALLLALAGIAAVPNGSAEKAREYYTRIAKELSFRDSATMLDSTLDDVLVYAGYAGLTAADLERLPSNILMDPVALEQPCTAQPCPGASDTDRFRATVAIRPLRPGDILASQFFAPKIINVNDPPATRSLGWRKLVRLRSRPGSPAAKHQIESVTILFNVFTKPGERPFSSESVNTQVMLTSTASNRDSIYWLDYGPLSAGGRLSLQLDASFEAADLQAAATGGIKPYFVPDGCNACHGDNPTKALINYLDTDHWFDRTQTDLSRVKQEGHPILLDAGTDDATTPAFARAFDVIRQLNEEANAHAGSAQPRGFHRLATRRWLRLHQNSNQHFPLTQRAVGSWTTPEEQEALSMLNQYCFRCHGTIKFDVFDKKEVTKRHSLIRQRVKPLPSQLKADPGFKMPPDRTLTDAEIDRLRQIIP